MQFIRKKSFIILILLLGVFLVSTCFQAQATAGAAVKKSNKPILTG